MKTAFYTLLIALLIFSCQSRHENDSKEKDIIQKEDSPDELRHSLQRKEAGNPGAYLSYNFVQKEPYSGAAYLKGTLKNNASVVTFRDAVIEVRFLDESDSVIMKTIYTCHKIFLPNTAVDFNIDFNLDVKKVKDIEAGVINATAVL
jgi:hypothetical protein